MTKKAPGALGLLIWGSWIALSLYTFWGVQSVPFHPDESTYLFMSADFETYSSQLGALAWDPTRGDEAAQRYRLLDAPVTRYVIGLGRWITGAAPLPVDWDWSKSWLENKQAGALPSDELLCIGRLTVTALLPITLLLVFLTGKKLGGSLNGLLAMLLLGSSALVLLHGRRAMAEGVLLFGVAFFNFTLFHNAKRPWLTALAAALAFNAKFSALALFPVGWLSVVWLPEPFLQNKRKVIGNTLQYLVVFLSLTLVLNPVLWNRPIHVLETAIAARGDLLERQLSDIQRLAPEQALSSPTQRFAVLGAHLYLSPLMFAEAGNYLENTAPAKDLYLSFTGHTLFRDPASAALLLFATLLGLALALKSLPEQKTPVNRVTILLILATIAQIGAYVIAIPLHWQRYVIPLVPYLYLWSGFGLSVIFKHIYTRIVGLRTISGDRHSVI